MALFKISKGNASDLPSKATSWGNGYAWFTQDDGKFYIDYYDGDETQDNPLVEAKKIRQPLNAYSADRDELGNVIKEAYASSLSFNSDSDSFVLSLYAKDGTLLSTVNLVSYDLSGSLSGNTYTYTLTPFQLITSGNSTQRTALTSDATSATIPAMTGASLDGTQGGTAGLVPAPGAGAQDMFLRGDGSWVDLFSQYDAMIFKGTIGETSSPTFASIGGLPRYGYNAGWVYRVVTAAAYLNGQWAEIGDLIIATHDGPATDPGNVTDADWVIAQANVDGAVYMGHGNTAIGSTTQPVYVQSSGLVAPTDYSLSASVNAATAANQIAYYNTTTSVSGHSQITAGTANLVLTGTSSSVEPFVRLVNGDSSNPYYISLVQKRGGRRGLYQSAPANDSTNLSYPGGDGWLLYWDADESLAKFGVGGIKTGNIVIGNDAADDNTSANSIANVATGLRLKTTTQNSIYFVTNNVDRARISSAGNFLPVIDSLNPPTNPYNSGYNIGDSVTRWDKIYAAREVNIENNDMARLIVTNTDTNNAHSIELVAGSTGLAGVYDLTNAFYALSTDRSGNTTLGCDTTSQTINFVKGSTTVASFGDDGHFLPGATDTYNLGSSSLKWNNIYMKKAYIGSSNSYGSSTNPIYWNDGIPAASDIQVNSHGTTQFWGISATAPATTAGGSSKTHGRTTHRIALIPHNTGLLVWDSDSSGGQSSGIWGLYLENQNRLLYTNLHTSDSGNYISATTSGHYASSTKVAINSTTEPTENLYVNGQSRIAPSATSANCGSSALILSSNENASNSTIGLEFLRGAVSGTGSAATYTGGGSWQIVDESAILKFRSNWDGTNNIGSTSYNIDSLSLWHTSGAGTIPYFVIGQTTQPSAAQLSYKLYVNGTSSFTDTISRHFANANENPAIRISSYNKDATALLIGHSSTDAAPTTSCYKLVYHGTGASPNNYLQLFGYDDSSTEQLLYRVSETGAHYFGIGTSDQSSNKRFLIYGNNRYLSFGGSGIQAYTSADAGIIASGDTKTNLYLQYNGGPASFGYTSAQSDVSIYGNLIFNRSSAAQYGRIYWYNKDYYTWVTYLGTSQIASSSPTGATPPSFGNIGTWALRSLAVNSTNCGWIWEAAANSSGASITPRMGLSSNTGQLRIASNAATTTCQSGSLILSSAENGSNGNVALELWRGTNGSWQIANEGAILKFRSNYTSSTQSTYSVLSLTLNYNSGNVTVGSSTGGSLGIANTDGTSGTGISLYNGAVTGKPTYGLMFADTGTFGKHGNITAAWATYFTMNNDSTRGWIFQRGTTNVASIAGNGCVYIEDDLWAGSITTTQEIDIGVTSKAGRMFMYSGSAVTSDKGIYLNNAANRGVEGATGNSLASGGISWNQNNEVSALAPLKSAFKLTTHGAVYVNTTIRYVDWVLYKNDAKVGETWYDTGDATNNTTGRFWWRQWSPTSAADTALTSYYEQYGLPEVTKDRTGNGSYTILTTKGHAAPSKATQYGVAYYSATDTITSTAAGTAGYVLQSNATSAPTWTTCKPYLAASTSKAYVVGTTATGTSHRLVYYNASVYTTGSVLYGAAWNDYAEYRKDNLDEKDQQQPGRCVKEKGDGSLTITTKRLERGCEIISDTFGFAIGQDEENGYNTPIASNGRVLAYPYESIEEFASHIGWPVCSGPDGTVSIMTEEEEEKYSSRIIGTISEIPSYETWGAGNVEVNGRVWIRIK